MFAEWDADAGFGISLFAGECLSKQRCLEKGDCSVASLSPTLPITRLVLGNFAAKPRVR